MNTRSILAGALVLVGAACSRPPEDATPPSNPAVPDQTAPAPAQEMRAPDTLAPATPAAASGTQPVGTNTPADARPAPTTPPTTTGTGETPATQPAPAQDEGAVMLQRAAEAYAKLNSLRADFVMHFNNPLLKMETTSRGTLYQRRPDRIALRFTDPAGDVILSDGEYYWLYYPSVDAKQVIRCPAEGGEQGVDLQAQFVGDPVRRFRYTLHAQESVGGRTASVLTLEPRERAEYRKLKVWLDTRDALARRFELTEDNGNVRRFDLTNFQPNANVADAVFRFTPPADARTVNCR